MRPRRLSALAGKSESALKGESTRPETFRLKRRNFNPARLPDMLRLDRRGSSENLRLWGWSHATQDCRHDGFRRTRRTRAVGHGFRGRLRDEAAELRIDPGHRGRQAQRHLHRARCREPRGRGQARCNDNSACQGHDGKPRHGDAGYARRRGTADDGRRRLSPFAGRSPGARPRCRVTPRLLRRGKAELEKERQIWERIG